MENLDPNIQDLLCIDEAETYINDDSAPEQEEEILEDKIEQENIKPVLKLDYQLKTCAERAELVNRIVAQTPQENLTHRYLEILGDYIMGGISKEEKKQRLYLTDNRRITIDRRETSFEGLAEKFENGEDGIYNLIVNDKNILLSQKNNITEKDIQTIPGLKELRDEIDSIDKACKNATGKKKYLLKKQLIEMRKDQYILKSIFKPSLNIITSARSSNKIDLTEHRWIDNQGIPHSDGIISFFDPKHVSALLCFYSALKLETHARFQDDFYYLLQDFDILMNNALKDEPLYFDLVKMKIKNKTNLEIQQFIEQKYQIKHSIEYISALWRNKIPKLIAEYAKKDFIIWSYTNDKRGFWKTCSKCGETKPAHNYFFSKNNSSKDGFYSICKDCRNQKNKQS